MRRATTHVARNGAPQPRCRLKRRVAMFTVPLPGDNRASTRPRIIYAYALMTACRPRPPSSNRQKTGAEEKMIKTENLIISTKPNAVRVVAGNWERRAEGGEHVWAGAG